MVIMVHYKARHSCCLEAEICTWSRGIKIIHAQMGLLLLQCPSATKMHSVHHPEGEETLKMPVFFLCNNHCRCLVYVPSQPNELWH